MTGSVFRAMLLGFLRDRGALAMSFALPVAFFLVFAAIFAGAGGESLRVRLAVADEVGSEASRRLLRAVTRDAAIEPASTSDLTAAQVRERVRRGSADVGLVVRAGGEPLDALGGLGPAPLLLVVEPTRAVAAQMVEGRVQRAYFAALPDVALRGVVRLIEDELVELAPDQRAEVDEGLAEMRDEALRAESEGRPSPGTVSELFDRETVAGHSTARNHVAYYAGAVAFLFLLFSTVHGALSLLEERDAGILERLLVGPGGFAVLLRGKLLFLAVQGVAQVSLIFVVAWLVHGVELPRNLPGFALVTAASALAAAGASLALTCACATRRQAQTLSNVAILIVSAVGGSMVPRFFMPPLLRDLGWLTPNAWALEAYTSVFWRGEPLSALALPVALLLAMGAAGYGAALRLSRRRETI